MTSPLLRILDKQYATQLQQANITVNPPLLTKEIDISSIPTRIGIKYTKPKKGITSQSKFISDVFNEFKLIEKQCHELFDVLVKSYPSLDEYDIADVLCRNIDGMRFDYTSVQKRIHSIMQYTSILKEFELLDNIDDYPDVFPLARKNKRKIVAYLGDTNSGKTWNAMQHIAQMNNTAYMAPLRLLAHETYEEMNSRGVPTSLVTGEERILVENSRCTSSTVECFESDKHYDAIIIDEIQMIDDIDRGAFFVQALVGANANEIIVTGPKEYAKRISDIANYLGDDVEIKEFKRMSDLKPLKKPIKIKDIKPNTAIVAFSKKDVYLIQQKLPKHLKSTVLYGALGYDVRQTQAERFRNGEVDVIVTTDCIGMGLNLPIETVVFSSCEKYNGYDVRPIGTMLAKQICGRAGRFGKFDTGYYGALSTSDTDYIKTQMSRALKPKKGQLSVLPPKGYIQTLLRAYDLAEILESWQNYVTFKREDTIFKPAKLSSQISIAKYLQSSYHDYKRYWDVIYCPVDMEKQYHEFHCIMVELFKNDKITLPNFNASVMGQNALEQFLKEITIFQWFFNKYPDAFVVDAENQIKTMIDECNYHLNLYLKRG